MAAFSRSAPILRQFLPRLTGDFITAKPLARAFTPYKLYSFTPTAALSQYTRLRNSNSSTFTANAFEQAETAAINAEPITKSKSSFPKTSHKSVAYWLLGSAVSVFGIVVFGGLTRLTESGLVNSCVIPTHVN
jgi:cytochrome c oxidase assembly protein subunit 15